MSRAVSRRALGGLAGASAMTVAGLKVAGWPGALGSARPGHLLRSEIRLPAPFQQPFAIPPEARPVSTGGDADRYEITQRVTTHELLTGQRTELWTYDGSFPGPTFRVRSGRPISVSHRNELPAPAVVHLHGGHTPHASDGYPTDLILPAGDSDMHSWMRMPGMPMDPDADVTVGERTYRYPLDQRGMTLWYHDHRMGFTGPSVWRGLAGFLIVEDDEEARLSLPTGERDVPMMICDRAFAADGALRYPFDQFGADTRRGGMPGVDSEFMNGVLGDVILVNGVPWPLMKVAGVKYRFRILNASNARDYRLALDPPPPGGSGFVQIGSDGGLLERSVRRDRIDISPAERFDVVIDFARYRPGTRVRLVNRLGANSTAHVMQFVIGRRSRDDSRVPDRLSTIEPFESTRAGVRRRIQFRQGSSHQWMINDHDFDPTYAAAQPRLGQLEVWQLVSDFAHPVHVHLNQFQVLRRNVGGRGDFDDGWKDTVAIRPAEMVEIAVRFTDYAGRFVFHCHNLEHEDMAMMANFVTR